MSEFIKNNNYEYRKIQGLVGEASLTLVLPKQYAINLGIRKGDFVKVFMRKDLIIVQKADD